MRYLTAACPAISRVILVESGPRRVLERAIPRLRESFGQHTSYHLVTCYPGTPEGLDAGASVWRTQDHAAGASRSRLLAELTATGATVLAVVCSNDDIMTRWKWWLAWKLPMKVLIVNENADAFWVDTANLAHVRRFLAARAGLTGEIAGRTAARLLMLPLVVAYLLLWASIAHARRWIHVTLARRRILKTRL